MVNKVPATQRVIDAFERQSAFLRAALGVASLLSRFEALLARDAELQPRAALSSTDQQLLDALLGCVVLKNELAHIFAQASEVPAAGASKATAPLPSLRSLLR